MGLLLLLASAPMAQRQFAESRFALLVSSSYLQMIFCLVALVGAAASAQPRTERLALFKSGLSAWRSGLVVLGMLGISEALETVIVLGGIADSGTLAVFREASSGLRGWALAAGITCLGIAPALGEELLFRGLLQRGLESALGKGAALVTAALVFGAAHLDPVQAPVAFVLGLYLGAVLIRARSLWPGVLCHGANNCFALLAAAYGLDFGTRSAWQIPIGLLFAAIGILAANPGLPRPATGELPAR